MALSRSKFTKLIVQLIPYAAKNIESFFFVTHCCGWIFNAPMKAPSLARKHGTLLICVVTYGDHVIEFLSYKFVN